MYTLFTQFLVQPADLISSVRENNDALYRRVSQQIQEHREPLPTRNQIHALINRCCRDAFGFDLHRHRLKSPLFGQIHDVLSKSG